MRYAIRVVIGAALGLIAAVGLHFVLGTWWVGAIIAALLGLIGFLGSFFIWTADRPEEGYEQVLFDMKNNIVSLVLILVVVGAAFGAAKAFAPKAAPLDPQVQEMNNDRALLVGVYNQIVQDKLDATKLGQAQKDVAEAKKGLTNVTSDKAKGLLTAANALETALNDYASCSDFAKCSLAKADAFGAKQPLNDYKP